jgi:alkylated DNA repair dioxygenase AlkB
MKDFKLKLNHREFYERFVPKSHADNLFNLLKSEIPWRQVNYYKKDRDKNVITPRLTYVTGNYYENQGNPHPEWLLKLKTNVEIMCNEKFNFILYAYYRDGNDSITWHSDDERFLGENNTIAGVSFGNLRDFQLKNKVTKEIEKIPMAHGDMVIMKNNCQKDYEHAVLKTKENVGERISLTFRKAITSYANTNYYTYN